MPDQAERLRLKWWSTAILLLSIPGAYIAIVFAHRAAGRVGFLATVGAIVTGIWMRWEATRPSDRH